MGLALYLDFMATVTDVKAVLFLMKTM